MKSRLSCTFSQFLFQYMNKPFHSQIIVGCQVFFELPFLFYLFLLKSSDKPNWKFVHILYKPPEDEYRHADRFSLNSPIYNYGKIYRFGTKISPARFQISCGAGAYYHHPEKCHQSKSVGACISILWASRCRQNYLRPHIGQDHQLRKQDI